MRKVVTFVIMLAAVMSACAQTMDIYGHVRDAFTKAGIPGTKITIMRSDSTVLDTTRVYQNSQTVASYDATYSFVVERKAQLFIIKAEHPDYETCYVNLNVKKVGRNTWFDAPWHYMTRKPKRISNMDKTLAEVIVRATRVQLYYKGDTIIFNADAFNAPEGSMLDALIRQMPGVELKENGEIFVNGRKVDNLTLNGKNFFKGNNQIVLRNLPYYTVETIKVYDDDTEYNKWLGRTEEEKELRMDVVLRTEHSVGLVGNSTAGGGTDQTWLARLFLMGFSDNSRVVAFSNANNIGQLALAYGDQGDWYTQNRNTGNTRYTDGTVNWTCNDADNTRSNEASVQVSHMRQDLMTLTQSENYLAAGNTFGRDISSALNSDLSVVACNRFYLKVPFRMVSEVSAMVGRNTRDTHGAKLLTADEEMFDIVNQMLARGNVLNKTFSFSADNDFDIKTAMGDALHLSFSVNYDRQTNESFGQDTYRYFRTPENNDFRNRYDDTPSHNFDVGGQTSYGMNWGSVFTLKPYLKSSYSRNNSNAFYHRLDALGELWAVPGGHKIGSLPYGSDSLFMAIDLANCYENTNTQLMAGGGLEATLAKDIGGNNLRVGANLPVAYQRRSMDYRSLPLTTTVSRENTTFSPTFNVSFSANQYQQYFLLSLGKTDQLPSLMYLVDRRSDTNPLAVQTGNPDLKMAQNYNAHLIAQLRSNRTHRYLSLMGNYVAHHNAVATGYEYDPSTGRRTYCPTNINGIWNAGVDVECGTPLDTMQHWFLSINGSYGFDRAKDLAFVVGETGSGMNVVNNHKWSVGGNISFTNGSLTTDANWTYRRRHILRATGADQSLAEYDCGFNLSYTLPWHVSLSSRVQMCGRRGYEQAQMNDDDFVWSATVSRSFLQGNRLIVTVIANDILGQLSNISYNVNAQGRTETWRNTVTRYVLLTLTYKFNRIPKKKA